MIHSSIALWALSGKMDLFPDPPPEPLSAWEDTLGPLRNILPQYLGAFSSSPKRAAFLSVLSFLEGHSSMWDLKSRALSGLVAGDPVRDTGPVNIVLFGDRGSGKTHMLYHIARFLCLHTQLRVHILSQYRDRFVSLANLSPRVTLGSPFILSDPVLIAGQVDYLLVDEVTDPLRRAIGERVPHRSGLSCVYTYSPEHGVATEGDELFFGPDEMVRAIALDNRYHVSDVICHNFNGHSWP